MGEGYTWNVWAHSIAMTNYNGLTSVVGARKHCLLAGPKFPGLSDHKHGLPDLHLR